MGYRFMNEQDFYDIYRRWNAGQTISGIAEQERRDRKTVRLSIRRITDSGIEKASELISREDFFLKYPCLKPDRQGKSKVVLLEDFKEELVGLINHPKDGMKPKTAFEVICARHQLGVSYSSFKRFSRENGFANAVKKETIRLETGPAEEIQIDYGKVGLLDYAGSNKTVQAFIGIMAHSRLPFVQFVFSQNQESFVESNIDMLEFYGGVPARISLDNLKTGVLSPDLYDPKINQAYAEFAEFYGTFIDPCRPVKPKDKAKVERMVPVARELFRKLKAIYPTASISELNEKALEWSRGEYGMRDHGTTGMKPKEVFDSLEKPLLKNLPSERLITPVWKKAKVHPDQFVQFEKKRYSLPPKFRGEEVLVRRTGHLVKIFFQHELIREFAVPKGNSAYEKTDFPEHIREMLSGGYPKYILDQSMKYGEAAYRLIHQILEVHGNLNCRRALGFLNVMEKFSKENYFSEVCEKSRSSRLIHPKIFKNRMENERNKAEQNEALPISETGAAMTRDVNYFFH